MADIEHITPEMQQFIESMGLYYEQFGLPRIGGRIIGLLMLADRPLTLDDMATALGVSRASVSTNVRMAVGFDFAEPVSLPGDRRDYYRFKGSSWDRALDMSAKGWAAMRRIAEQGLDAIDPGDRIARERFDDMLDFCNFISKELQEMIEHWRERRRSIEQAKREQREA